MMTILRKYYECEKCGRRFDVAFDNAEEQAENHEINCTEQRRSCNNCKHMGYIDGDQFCNITGYKLARFATPCSRWEEAEDKTDG